MQENAASTCVPAERKGIMPIPRPGPKPMTIAALLSVVILGVSGCNTGTADDTGQRSPAARAASAAPGHSDAAPAPACFRDFDAFLSAFATDPSVRDEYTLPEVAVTYYASEEGLGHIERTDSMAKADYQGFNLHHDSAGFHVIDSEGEVDPDVAPLGIATEPDGAYLVSYRYGVSEGRSFRFVQRPDCWYLAAQPDSGGP